MGQPAKKGPPKARPMPSSSRVILPMNPAKPGLREGVKTYYVPLSLIDRAPYNPRNESQPHLTRDNPDGRHVRRIASSWKEMGQLDPVTLHPTKNGRYVLSDGHCRFAAAKLLGLDEIWAVVSDVDPVAYYVTRNGETLQHSANAKLLSFLVNPLAVSDHCQTAYQNMVRGLGRPLTKKLALAGHSLATYKQAVKLSRYCGIRDDEMHYVRDVVRWLVDHKQTFAARKAVEAKVAPVRILVAILKGKKIEEVPELDSEVD